ncbi:MAG: MFS transporter, partial [Clostridiales bacterium]|nr:MFS transporter [Clostridiales bacterium]
FGKLLHSTRRTKWGKYKPYLLFLAPVLGVFAIAATWLPQFDSESARAIYAYVTCIPTLVLFNIVLNTFNMMPAVLTPNRQERSDMWAPVGLIINFAPTIIGVIKGWLRNYFKSIGQEYLSFRYMGLIGVVIGICLIILLLKTKERVYEVEEKKEKIKFWEGLKLVLKNKPLMIFTIALSLGCLKSVLEMNSEMIGQLRYADTFGKGLGIFASLTLIVGFAATPNMLLLPLFMRKFNNRTIVIGWQVINTVAYLILALIRVENIPVGTTSATVITIVRFFAAFNAIGSLIPLMLSEIYDYQQWKTGKRLEGFIQTFAYAAVLLVTQLALLIPAFIQKSMDYNPKQFFNKEVGDVSVEMIQNAIRYFDIALWISVASGALFIVVMLFYNLDKKKHAAIIAELKSQAIDTFDGGKEKEKTGEQEPAAESDGAAAVATESAGASEVS